VPDPRTRRKARESALHFLFGLEFTHYPWEEALDGYWTMRPARPAIKHYATTLIRGVAASHDVLDQEIAPAIEHWAPQRVGRVERTILRIALYEIRHVPDVPRAVAINEAIELAKAYGTDDAPRFINGVLDRLGRAEAPQNLPDEESDDL